MKKSGTNHSGGRPQEVRPEPVDFKLALPSPKVWISENLAQDWFNDALNEAKSTTSRQAMRREIIFAACFSETYLFEFTRRFVGVDKILEIFSPDEKSGHIQKWKHALNELRKRNMLTYVPGRNEYDDLLTLIDYRNGFVHAHASRPATDDQPERHKPYPTREDIESLKPGWAINTVVNLISKLHEGNKIELPDYIKTAYS